MANITWTWYNIILAIVASMFFINVGIDCVMDTFNALANSYLYNKYLDWNIDRLKKKNQKYCEKLEQMKSES